MLYSVNLESNLWSANFSQKKNKFDLFAFLLFTANISNSSVRFLGESTARHSAFRNYLTYRDTSPRVFSLMTLVKSYMHFFLLVFSPIFSKLDNHHNNKVKKGLKSCNAKRLIYLIGISKCSHFFLVEVIYFLHCRHKSRALRTAIAPQNCTKPCHFLSAFSIYIRFRFLTWKNILFP